VAIGKFASSSSVQASKLQKLSYSLPADVSTGEGVEIAAEKLIK